MKRLDLILFGLVAIAAGCAIAAPVGSSVDWWLEAVKPWWQLIVAVGVLMVATGVILAFKGANP